MSSWTVHYWGEHGLCSKVVAAGSKQSALALAEVPAARVVKVAQSWMFSVASLDFGASLKPSLKVQTLFVARALALFVSGRAALVNRLIVSLPELNRIAKRHPQSLRDDIELSAKLRYLAFATGIVAIIESGEKTGRLVTALETSLTYLKQLLEASRNSSRQFVFGVILVVVSLLTFFLIPLLLTEPINMLTNLRGVKVEFTTATYVLLFVNTLVRDYWWLLSAVTCGGFVLTWRFRHALLQLPLLQVFGKLRKIRRSIHFLVTWRAFRVAGIPLEGHSRILVSTLGAHVAAYILGCLQRGESLTEALSQRFFSPTLVLALGGASQVDRETFTGIADMLLISLYEEQRAGASQAATAMYATGAVLTITTAMLLAFGLIFPIMGASAGAS